MLNALIRGALQHRVLTIAAALLVFAAGLWQALHMPIDVFPDLDRPRVTIMTECPGLAPEEVETLVTFPLESVLNGASHVTSVRSTSSSGLSVILVDFEWGADLFQNRQMVNERLQLVGERLPPGVRPTLAPMSSIMGQVAILSLWSETGATTPMELRTLGDWVIRQRLLTVPGVAQIFTLGGERKQFQVLVDPDALTRLGIELADVRQALEESNQNATGGILDQQGPDEILVRSIGRIQSIRDLEQVVVGADHGRPVALSQVASIREGAQVKRGDGAAFRRSEQGELRGGPAVVLTISKQPGADTRAVTDRLLRVIEQDLRAALPEDVRLELMYSQRSFIDRAIANILEALRDGGVLVVIVLFLFLLSLRSTFITLTAIPLSLAITALVFTALGLSINTMSLGGLAVAIGELVDDAIVDLENIFRRLKENQRLSRPLSPLLVVYRASAEIRNSIVFGTMIVILVFLPIFALSGMEGRLFTPLAIAYIVSILASLLVSLTVTPVLSYWLLGSQTRDHAEREGPLLRLVHAVGSRVIRFSLNWPWTNLLVTAAAVLLSAVVLSKLDRDFLPPFNEGAVQLNVLLPPGTSLATTREINLQVEQELAQVDDVLRFVRRTGRAELDEHADPVSHSEYILELDPHSRQSREQQLQLLRQRLEQVPGVITAVDQPLSHLISHMISGVKAQIGIKVFGDDLERLRRTAESLEAVIKTVPGVTDLYIEPLTLIPQLQIELQPQRLLLYGLTAQRVNTLVETALNGAIVSEVLQGQRTYDLVLRLEDEAREDVARLRRLPLELPGGGSVPLEAIARIELGAGPNAVNRENVRRRVLLQCNVAERGLVDVVDEIRAVAAPIARSLPEGWYIEYGGQFESQQSASRMLGALFVVSLCGVFLVLFTMFNSVNLSLQVMAALPMAFIGAVWALVLTGQTLTVAALVGFISLAGIASRNGILLLNHYLHLVRHEGEGFTREMVIRAGRERLAPVLMTALTSGIGLTPLVLAAEEPGKEILYPVATVILGGLISSTLLDFFVHPALFWLFGRRAAERVVSRHADDALTIEPAEAAVASPPAAV